MNPTNAELDLRRRLRALPREREMQHDLWPGIAARIERGPAQRRPGRRRSWLIASTSLLAASLVLVWGLVHNFTGVVTTATRSVSVDTDRWSSQLVRREADAITIEYQRASAPLLSQPLPDAIRGAVVELDHSAVQIRDALRTQPDATYLLERLRRTQERRLHLLQRVALS